MIGAINTGGPAQAQAAQPNIIHVFVDDLGWGSTGFNGSTKILTPNLDAYAAAGLKFNQAYAATICSPSRGMLYTGYHMGHAINDENVEQFRYEDIMLGTVMKGAGYDTSIFGKWGFGGTAGSNTSGNGTANLKINPTINNPQSLPTNHGYDEFVGYLNHVQAHHYFIDPLWKADPGAPDGVSHYVTGNNAGDNVTNTYAAYADDIHAAEAEAYVEAHANQAEPFFMQMNFNIPHADYDGIAQVGYDIDGNPQNWDAGYESSGLTDKQKKLAAMITRMDAHFGSLMDRLEDPNDDGDTSDSIAADTLVIFTSDNGSDPGDGLNGSAWTSMDANGPWRGGKRDLFEGGTRVPMFAYWPGTVTPGVSDHITDLTDFMAAAAELGGIDAPVGIDGVSFVGELTGEGVLRKKDYHVWEHHEWDGPDSDGKDARWSVLKDDIKLIKYSNGVYEMYDLNTDPAETTQMDLVANAALKDELEAIAVAEGLTQPADGYSMSHVNWAGGDGDSMQDSAKWSNYNTQQELWVSVVNNTGVTASVAHSGTDLNLLGLEVRGEGAMQTVRAGIDSQLGGRNEVRIATGGRVQLDAATLTSARWVDVKAGGQLTGHGQVVGDVYNWGTVSPGLPSDLPQPSDPPPPPDPIDPPIGVDTGLVDAVVFDFTGTQDQSPLNQTSTLNQYVALSQGLSYGPGVQPRGTANAGDEYNVMFWNATTMQGALNNSDYIHFKVDPIPGIEMLVDEISFRIWRNGPGAAKEHATFTSLDGFTSGDELATFGPYVQDDGGSPLDIIGIANQVVLTAQYTGGQWTGDEVEVRFYGWNASHTNSYGNTHINDVRMTASFRSTAVAPNLAVAFDFTGVQDDAPLNATSTLDSANVTLTHGLDFGPGVVAKGAGDPTNQGDEFNAKDWSTGATLGTAIFNSDYLFYRVQPVAGIEMQLDRVNFDLARENGDSPTGFAVMTSLDGFSSGDEIDTFTLNDTATHALSAQYAGSTWTTDEVEVRLYGWGANNFGANAHVTAASLSAHFRSIGGSQVVFDPTGALTLNGDFFHVQGGMMELDLAGTDNSDPLDPQYDQVLVSGDADLAGGLSIATDGAFVVSLGDEFIGLTASGAGGITGTLDQTAITGWELPDTTTDNAIAVLYEDSGDADSLVDQVRLFATIKGDANGDGTVSLLDLNALGAGFGQAGTWQDGDFNYDGTVSLLDLNALGASFGESIPTAPSVPEPASMVLLAIGGLALMQRR